MYSDTWKQLPKEEWIRRLRMARSAMLVRLGRRGLHPDDRACGGEDIDGLLMTDDPKSLGNLLRPGLADVERVLANYIKAAGNPEIVTAESNYSGSDSDLSAILCEYAMGLTEAAYLLGVIAGVHSTWPVVEALEAPYAPPTPPARRPRKGGAR